VSPGQGQKSAKWRPIFSADAEIVLTGAIAAEMCRRRRAAKKTGQGQTLVATFSETGLRADSTWRRFAARRREISQARRRRALCSLPMQCLNIVLQQVVRIAVGRGRI
jgi:hypothetical protein